MGTTLLNMPEKAGTYQEYSFDSSGDKATNKLYNVVALGEVISEGKSGIIVGNVQAIKDVANGYDSKECVGTPYDVEGDLDQQAISKSQWDTDKFWNILNDNVTIMENPLALHYDYVKGKGRVPRPVVLLKLVDRSKTGAYEQLSLDIMLERRYYLEGDDPVYPCLRERGVYGVEMSPGEKYNFVLKNDQRERCDIGNGFEIRDEETITFFFKYMKQIKSYTQVSFIQEGDELIAKKDKIYDTYNCFLLKDAKLPAIPEAPVGYKFGGWYTTSYVNNPEALKYFQTREMKYQKEIGVNTENFEAYLNKKYLVTEESMHDNSDMATWCWSLYARWNPVVKAETVPPNNTIYIHPITQPSTTGAVKIKLVKKGQIKYRLDLAKKTAKVVGMTSKKVKKVTIPSTIANGGKKYKVTSIQSKAFIGCKRLKQITVQGSNLKTVRKTALKGASKSVKIKAKKRIRKLF